MRKLLLSACVFALYPSFSFAAKCAQEDELHALDIRALQSSMMVAALSCNQQPLYNKFMKKHQDNFVEASEETRTYFKREYGSYYESQLNRFVTKLANEATKDSLDIDADEYCQQMASMFKQLLSADDEELEVLAEQKSFTSMHGVNACS